MEGSGTGPPAVPGSTGRKEHGVAGNLYSLCILYKSIYFVLVGTLSCALQGRMDPMGDTGARQVLCLVCG